jgi:hypothetical protein
LNIDGVTQVASKKIIELLRKQNLLPETGSGRLEERIQAILLKAKEDMMFDFFNEKDRNISFRHSCKGSGCFILKSPDFQKMLKGVFPGSIRPGDVDCEVEIRVSDHRNAIVEKKSHFLVLESKRAHEAKEKLNNGQRLTFLAKAREGASIIIIYHDKPDGSDIVGARVWNIPSYVNGSLVRCDLDKFRGMCSLWFSLVMGTYNEKGCWGGTKEGATEKRIQGNYQD